MGKLYCLKHPQYRGEAMPILGCKNCCEVFIDSIRSEQEQKNSQKQETTREWLERKKNLAQDSTAQSR